MTNAYGTSSSSTSGTRACASNWNRARCDSIACCSAANRGANLSPCRSRLGRLTSGGKPRPLARRTGCPGLGRTNSGRSGIYYSPLPVPALSRLERFRQSLSWLATIAFTSQSGSPNTCCLCTSRPNCSKSEKLKPCKCFASVVGARPNLKPLRLSKRRNHSSANDCVGGGKSNRIWKRRQTARSSSSG